MDKPNTTKRKRKVTNSKAVAASQPLVAPSQVIAEVQKVEEEVSWGVGHGRGLNISIDVSKL